MLKKITKGLLCASLLMSFFPATQVHAEQTRKRHDEIILKFKGSGLVNIYKDEKLTKNVTYFSKTGQYGGDAALLEETDNAYKIMIAGTVGYVAKGDGVIPLEESDLKGVSYYSVNSSGELYHRISSDPEGTTYTSSIVMGPAPDYLDKGEVYYSYDGHYFYEDIEDMIDNYRDGEYDDAVNEDEPYYNYYMYLPLHAKSNYDGDDFNEYIEDVLKMKDVPEEYPAGKNESMIYDHGDSFYEVQEEYGINALIMFAICMNETGSGTSKLAIENYNMFGLGAVDSNPNSAREYDDVYDCIEKFAAYHMNWGYLDFADSRYFGGSVGDKASGLNVKYCSDPYWGEKAAMYCYRVDKALGMEDYEAYTIAIHEEDDEYDLHKEPKSTSDIIASPKTVPFMPYLVIGEEGKYYQVLTDFHLDEDRNRMKHNEDLWYLPYDYENNYAYIKKSELTVISNGNQTIGGKDSVLELDPALLAQINIALGKKEDAEITSTAARKVTELELDASTLTSLDGIEAFTKLKSLTLTDLNADTDITAIQRLNVLEEIAITPKSAEQVYALEDCKMLESVTLYDYTVKKASDLPELKVDSFILSGGANKDLSLLKNIDADELEVADQKLTGELEVNGEVMVYTNQIYDAVGDLIDLSKAKVMIDGKKTVSSYDKSTNQLSFQAASGAHVEIKINLSLRGQVNSYSAVIELIAERADLSVNGWQTIGNNTYYVENNALTVEWKQIDGIWYYFLDNGALATGWTKDKANCWYMLDYKTGAMKTGWVADGKEWYYLNPANGIMQTGWQMIDGTEYYLLTSGKYAGAMATGIVKIEDKFYEFTDGGLFIGETEKPEDWVDEEVSKPVVPEEPETPVEPEEPVTPETPVTPEEPVSPEEPETPESPVVPEEPVEPETPVTPETPATDVVYGWLETEGGWKFFDYKTGEQKFGWIADGVNWYYMDYSTGIMYQETWIARDASGSVWYYVDANGAMVFDTWIGNEYVDANGEWHA